MRTMHGSRTVVLFNAALLCVATSADAQLSLSTPITYDTGALGAADRAGLGRSFAVQAVRGALALIFPDGRAPITGAAEVERYVLSGAGLRGVALPGLNADTLAAWSMAKQAAVVNHARDGKAYPVLAVNSGWTDWFMWGGHLQELATLRPAVNAGRPCTGEPVSARVADLLQRRLDRQLAAAPPLPGAAAAPVEPIVLYGHSAGGAYVANVAQLLAARGKQYVAQLRAYNVGLAVPLPRGLRAVQIVGDRDVVAQVNSPNAGLLSASTRFERGLSHCGGAAGVGDSLNPTPWRIRPNAEVFAGRPGSRRTADPDNAAGAECLAELGPGAALSPAALRGAAKRVESLADARQQMAGRLTPLGAEGVVRERIAAEGRLHRLEVDRLGLIAEALEARRQGPAGAGARRAVLAKLARNRAAHRAAVQALTQQAAAVPRNMALDSMGFASMLTSECVANLSPLRVLERTAQATGACARMCTDLTSIWLGNPLVNPWGKSSGAAQQNAAWRGRAPAGHRRPVR